MVRARPVIAVGLGAILAVCGIARLSAQPDAARVRHAEIASAALGRALPVTIVSPVSPAAADAPVLFLLHGRGRHHRSLVDSPAARAALLAAPFYVVLPEGEDGWYIDSPMRPRERYGTYLEEVVAWADANLPVSRRRERRGIAGWSMGGYGAVRFAQTHAREFCFVASMIGLLDFPRAETLPEGQNYPVPVQRFDCDPDVWRTLNPLHAVEALQGSSVTLALATRGFERTMNENFIAALAAKKIPAQVHWLDGVHEFSLVERALPLVFADAAGFFERR